MNQLGKNLKVFRQALKLNQVDFGKLVGVPTSVICATEKGTNNLTYANIVKIVRFFKQYKIKFEDLA